MAQVEIVVAIYLVYFYMYFVFVLQSTGCLTVKFARLYTILVVVYLYLISNSIFDLAADELFCLSKTDIVHWQRIECSVVGWLSTDPSQWLKVSGVTVSVRRWLPVGQVEWLITF